MPKYHIWTIGCQMNKAESDRLGSIFEQQGFQATDEAGEADIIVLNSCVVRQSAENRALGKLQRLKPLKKANPNLTVALTGCLVDSNVDKLKKDFPYVDHFFKPGEIPTWLQAEKKAESISQDAPVSAYLPIIQGCDNFCSYCIVPYRRGRERSRPLSELVQEARELVRRGAREITLVGQNVDSYGHDLPSVASAKEGVSDKSSLSEVLKELNGIDGLYRLRFLTNHPKDMSSHLIGAIASLDKVCEQFNLPVQSGDDEILKLMRRDYTVEHYRRLIAEARHRIPGLAISTDVIVGFPTETAEQFQRTYDLLAELRFDAVHVAAYSTRPGTIAARELKDDVPAEEKAKRLAAIEELQAQVAGEINAGLLGKTVEVLVEGRKKGKWQGRARSDKLVFFTDSGNWRGKLANVRIEKTSPWSLQGSTESTEKGEKK